MNDHIARLGFDAWADNKFVNAIEDVVEGREGSMSIDGLDYRLNLWWDDKLINCIITAYAEGKWQTYEKYIKRPQETL